MELRDALAAFSEHPHGALFLSGTTGNGKSTLVASCLNKASYLETAIPVYVSVPELLDRIRSSMARQTEEAEALIEGLRSAELLALDEFGQQRETEWEYDQMTTLMDARYRMRPEGGTIIATNLTYEIFATRYPTIWSRLNEQGWGRVLHNLAPDLRINPEGLQ